MDGQNIQPMRYTWYWSQTEATQTQLRPNIHQKHNHTQIHVYIDGSCTYHDVGKSENLDKANIQLLDAKKDIPVPTGTNPADTHSRPGVIIATPDLSQAALTYTHITIV